MDKTVCSIYATLYTTYSHVPDGGIKAYSRAHESSYLVSYSQDMGDSPVARTACMPNAGPTTATMLWEHSTVL